VYRVKDVSNFDSWEFLQEFHDQAQPISEVDWSKDDKIISGSHDRSVFIYKRTGNLWQKVLVNIDIKLSILCVKWAPSSKKFALGASCNTLGIGFYNVETACWTTATKDKLCKSPIISVSFHPSSNIVAIGSTDNSVKIISCSFKKSKDVFVEKSDVEDKTYQGPFANVDSLFEILFQIEDVGGWVNHVSFELGGSFLLVLPHSNHFKLFDVADNAGKVETKEMDVKWNGLPFLSGFISDKGLLYLGGYDKKVAVFNRSSRKYLT
jgi:actin related protein 2/3 complex subunit 1A/1B